MEKPLVSIILTVYNAERFIRSSIESVLGQTYPDFELLIYNDGSTDGTKEIIESIKDGRIRFWSSDTNRHIAYGTNFLMKKCTGQYIAIIDGDDMWKPDKLEKQMAFLLENPQYDACFSWCDIIDASGNICNIDNKAIHELFKARTHTREHWLRYFFFEGNKLCNPSAVFTASSARAVGMHNLFYIQTTDMEWWVRFVKKFAFAVIEEPLVLYRANFDDKEKTSHLTELSMTRNMNEMSCMRMHFFEDMDDGLFISAFREYFVNKDASSPDELKCEKLFISLIPQSNTRSIPAAGIFLLEQAMADEKFADLLAEKYNFTTRTAGRYSETHILVDYYIEQYLKEYRFIKMSRQNEEIRAAHEKETAEINDIKQGQ